MSSISSIQRIVNDMTVYEQTSDHRVKPESYYIVKIETHDDTVDLNEFVKKDLVAKYIMGTSAISAYVYYNTAYILFSAVANGAHYLQGSHHELCSHYASNAALFTKSHVCCTIIEFESRTKIIIYFQTRIFENMKISIGYLSEVAINKQDLAQLTHNELVEKLDHHAREKWDLARDSERYGIFYKFQILDNGKKRFTTISELIDCKNMEKYTNYLFN